MKLWDVKSSNVEPTEIAAEVNRPIQSDVKRDLLKSFTTKRTPIYNVQFTSRNVLLAMGTFFN